MQSSNYVPYKYSYNDLKTHLLKTCHRYGLRERHFKHFNFKPSVKDDAVWNPGGYLILAEFLFEEVRLTPLQVMRELSGLMFYQSFALKENYSSGLRGSHLRDWRPSTSLDEFTYRHWLAVTYMIKELHYSPKLAVLAVSGLEDACYDVLKKRAIEHYQLLSKSQSRNVSAFRHLGLFAEVVKSDKLISSDDILERLQKKS